MFGKQVRLGSLVGEQAAVRHRVAVAGGDGRGHHQPDPALLEVQHLRVAELDRRLLPRFQAAERGCERSIAVLLHHHGRVALLDRLLVPLCSLLARHHLAAHALVAQRGLQPGQHRAPGQGEGVGHLDVRGLVVAEGLAQRHRQQQAAEAAHRLDRAQHHRGA